MVASRGSSSNPGRIPALGLRVLALIFISIMLMYFDNRDNHLDAVRTSIGAAVYPLRVIVDAPVRFWSWVSDSTESRNTIELELARLRAERLLTNARLQKFSSLEAENARLRALLDVRARVRDKARVAEIMSVDANPYSHSLVINVGTKDGVFDGQALIDVDGVIGQVIEAGLMTSQAMLISDTDHALPVEVNRNGLRTIVGSNCHLSSTMPTLWSVICWSRLALAEHFRPAIRSRSSNLLLASRKNPTRMSPRRQRHHSARYVKSC